MEVDFDSEFGESPYGDSGMGKFVIGGCVLLGVLALGGFIGKMTSSPGKDEPKQALPAVSVQQQMQQAALEMMHTQQQLMIDARRQMAEAERGYYEEQRMAEFGEYGDFGDGDY